jgi:hypothetical protein
MAHGIRKMLSVVNMEEDDHDLPYLARLDYRRKR